MAFEGARVLFRLGCDVRVYDATDLPVKDDVQHDHPKVQELRDLSRWSDAHFWVSPEQHGNLVRDKLVVEKQSNPSSTSAPTTPNIQTNDLTDSSL